MPRTRDRNIAIALRKKGNSYSQIGKFLGVGKGTLSYWLKDYPLSPERIRELRDWNERRIENYRETRRRNRETRLAEVYKEQAKKILPLTRRDMLIGGLFLYWGEGSKTRTSVVAITNTDPCVLKFFIQWLSKIFGVPKNRLKVSLHLYRDMNIYKAKVFWSRELNISMNQIMKPYIKKGKIADLTRKGGFGHGTCEVRLGDARLAERVILGIRAIKDQLI